MNENPRVAALVGWIDSTIERIRRDALTLAVADENCALFVHMGTMIIGLEALKRTITRQ